jgi:hypothetical protein
MKSEAKFGQIFIQLEVGTDKFQEFRLAKSSEKKEFRPKFGYDLPTDNHRSCNNPHVSRFIVVLAFAVSRKRGKVISGNITFPNVGLGSNTSNVGSSVERHASGAYPCVRW